MDDWREVLQSVFIGLIFSYLLAKLISIVISFREENLTVVRRGNEDSEIVSGDDESKTLDNKGKTVTKSITDDSGDSTKQSPRVYEEKMVNERNDYEEDDDDDDDDWEGVESTELDEAFSAATAFVAAAASDRLSQKVSNDMQLQLYGLYKIATEGPCSAPQPSALKMTARAKWQAWQKLGAMPPEEAMEKYIDIVTELYPSWLSGSSAIKKKGGDIVSQSADNKGPMGPVFSTFVYEEESTNDMKMDAIHTFAREGEVESLLKCIDSGVPVNLKDSEGRTPLHWAVDRGHLKATEVLVSRNADVNVKDNEGQTPLHYAVVCEREDIAEFLVKQNADVTIKDDDGESPSDICQSDWPWLHKHTLL